MTKYILLIVTVFCLSGCVEKVKSMFVETKKATPQYSYVGDINKNAPIIKEPKEAHKPIFEEDSKKINNNGEELEMVGYVVSYEKDTDTGLYVYTFTDALRTDRIKFYTKHKLPYRLNQLIKVTIKGNFLVDHSKYKNISGRRNFNHYIKAAKEFFIRVD